MAHEKRLTDANALQEKLQEHHDFFVDGVGGFRYLTPKDKARVDEITNCIAEIVNAPTVDAVEVVHGRWIHKGAWHIECSECHYILAHISEAKNYCPYCGAKMDGGNGDA